jgi:hypothetical protein
VSQFNDQRSQQLGELWRVLGQLPDADFQDIAARVSQAAIQAGVITQEQADQLRARLGQVAQRLPQSPATFSERRRLGGMLSLRFQVLLAGGTPRTTAWAQANREVLGGPVRQFSEGAGQPAAPLSYARRRQLLASSPLGQSILDGKKR